MKLKPKTKAQWRVAIMRDVIKQLDARKIIAQSGTYLRVGTDDHCKILNQAKLLGGDAPECRVCMLGATFLSAVRLDNKYEQLFCFTGSDQMHTRLDSYFTERQRDVIELVFERSWDGLYLFGKLSDETRLRFIANFIIKRKGLFDGTSPVELATGSTALEKAAAAFVGSEACKKSKAVKALA